MTQPDHPKTTYTLVRKNNYLALTDAVNPSDKPFYIDFLSDKLNYRIQQASLRKEMLAKAIGSKPKDNPMIIDTTAGLGRDSFILACLGYHITMLERPPIIYALLEDALLRARAADPEHPCHRMTLVQTDAIQWLPEHAKSLKPDVIYLDPMFPERKKSAAVKKEMQIMNALLGHDNDITQLLEISLACANKRVVVKRPRLSANSTTHKPNFSLLGKSTRFDIYLT